LITNLLSSIKTSSLGSLNQKSGQRGILNLNRPYGGDTLLMQHSFG